LRELNRSFTGSRVNTDSNFRRRRYDRDRPLERIRDRNAATEIAFA
jgi:hypothetical protein